MTTSQSIKRFANLFVCISLTSATAFGQGIVPSRTQCKQWDDSYLFLFNLILFAGVILPVVMSLFLPPLFGRRFWALTAPRMRILATTIVVVIVLSTSFVALPYVFGFGHFIFSGVDQSYFNCETVKFGATGLLFGLVGAGIAAISQWLAVLIILIASCALGGVIAFIVSEILVVLIGLRSRVRGTTA